MHCFKVICVCLMMMLLLLLLWRTSNFVGIYIHIRISSQISREHCVKGSAQLKWWSIGHIILMRMDKLKSVKAKCSVVLSLISNKLIDAEGFAVGIGIFHQFMFVLFLYYVCKSACCGFVLWFCKMPKNV